MIRMIQRKFNRVFADGQFNLGTGVRRGGAHKKGSQAFISETLAAAGGGEGSRTPVRKSIPETFSGRSQAFKIPLPVRRLTGLSAW